MNEEISVIEKRIEQLYPGGSVLPLFRNCCGYCLSRDREKLEQAYERLNSRVQLELNDIMFMSSAQKLPYIKLNLEITRVLKEIFMGETGTGTDERTVFIVHGHNQEMKESMKAFFLQLGFRPIVLGEQVKQGGTIIEMLEKYANRSGLAAVLLSADDEGGKAGSEAKRYRARQNVILEAGYFMGKFGREKVLIFKQSGCDIEIPSDLDGYLYFNYEHSGAWKLQAAQTVKLLGYAVDINDVRI